MSAELSGGTFVTFHIICCFALFLISSSTKTDKKKKKKDSVVASKYKLEKSPRGGSSQLQINWNLLYCLWAILQLDQCIMSWHGPSLCADSSVTLGDPVKFISAVSPSQLAGPPPPAPSLSTKLEMVSVPGGHEGNRIHHQFLLQVSDTSQRNMWLW